MRISSARARIKRLSCLPEDEQTKFFKGLSYKCDLRKYYDNLVEEMSNDTTDVEEADES